MKEFTDQVGVVGVRQLVDAQTLRRVSKPSLLLEMKRFCWPGKLGSIDAGVKGEQADRFPLDPADSASE